MNDMFLCGLTRGLGLDLDVLPEERVGCESCDNRGSSVLFLGGGGGNSGRPSVHLER